MRSVPSSPPRRTSRARTSPPRASSGSPATRSRGRSRSFASCRARGAASSTAEHWTPSTPLAKARVPTPHRESMTKPEIAQRAKELLVEGLRLETAPEDIVDADPIFGAGLGLDSIDALEFVVLIEETFG